MSDTMLSLDEKRRWVFAAVIAVAAHALLGLAAMAWKSPYEPPIPEPVVLVELPPAIASEAMSEPVPASQPEYIPPQQAVPFEVPTVRAPLPDAAILLPPESKRAPSLATPSAQASPTPVAAPSPARPALAPTAAASAVSSNSAGNSPKAKKEQANYYAMVSAHLNQRKKYPTEARKAREQGVVKVRFTVDRTGNISNVSITGSSGHAILDQATLALMQRVAPLPAMPASMAQDKVTISLPIDYSLRTR
ncbi:energy transducer TonB [Parasphingorhabdus sp.]|uniref:energy transducer TonB n=1 Tax=Parasphingorhabdus sp. TaxID=2709688 RepID=UPI002B27C07B|nr:energy transducer TonB [Parasphingorhabdus sp.]